MILLKFPSPNISMLAYNLLSENGIPCQVVPTPRELDSSCGVSLVVEGKYISRVRKAFDGSSLGVEEIEISSDSALRKILEG